MTIREEPLSEALLADLIALSVDWAAEESCHGYRANERADIEGERIFTVREDGALIGYLFGHMEHARETSTVAAAGTPYFEVEELYVRPERRSQGVGAALFRFAEGALRGETTLLMLGTATKNWRAILHFYLDELDMEFWSARLFKRI